MGCHITVLSMPSWAATVTFDLPQKLRQVEQLKQLQQEGKQLEANQVRPDTSTLSPGFPGCFAAKAGEPGGGWCSGLCTLD